MYSGRSTAYDVAIKSNVQKRKLRIIIDGEVLTEKDFISGSPKIKMSALPANALEFGGVVSKSFSASLQNNNKKYNGKRFNGKEVVVEAGLELPDGTIEYIPCGTFYVNYAGKPYSIIKIEAADKMLNAEKSYSSSTLTYPASLKQIAQDCASKMGISLLGDFKNSSYIVNSKPDVKLYTYRDILSFIASIAGGFARITRNNKLEIVSFIDNTSEAYELRPTDERINCTTDDMVTITGLAYYGDEENVLKGTDEYPIVLGNNPLLEGMLISDRETILEGLYNEYNGFTYWPYSSAFVGNPCLDEGDFVKFYDTIDGDVTSFIGSYILKLTGTETIEAPSCSELDKNFLDSNTYKKDTSSTRLNYAYNNGGGGSGTITTYTHNEYSDLNKPISTYLNTTGSTLKTYFSVKPTMDGEPLGSDGSAWVLIGYTRSIHVDPYSGNIGVEIKNIPANYDSQNRLLFDSSYLNADENIKPFVDFKLYTSEEYQQLLKMFNNNFNSIERWPILHAITPNRMDNSSRQGTIVPMEVSSSAIVSVDPYHDVREYQLAQALYNMFRLLNIYGFSDFFKSVEDVYHYLLAYRVEVDQGGYVPDSGTGGGDDSGSGGDNTGGSTDTGGTTDPEEPTDPEPEDPVVPTGFTNPLPSLTGSSANIQPASTNANLQALYSYDADTNVISLDYNYMNYNDWITQSANYQIDLSTIESDSTDSFTYTTTTTEDSKVTAAITAITFTFDTTNNKILIENTFTETDEADLNEVLDIKIELT